MFGKSKPKEERRYYLLPGMGKLNRKKRQQNQLIALAVGLIVSAILGLVYYFANRPAF